jgi:hypothetical protein
MAITKDPQIGILPEGQTLEHMGRQLCQHVVGMNPVKVGNLDDSSTWPKTKESLDQLEQAEKAKGRDESQNFQKIQKKFKFFLSFTNFSKMFQPLKNYKN